MAAGGGDGGGALLQGGIEGIPGGVRVFADQQGGVVPAPGQHHRALLRQRGLVRRVAGEGSLAVQAVGLQPLQDSVGIGLGGEAENGHLKG